jgi:ElaB/YqjD/DUF883 family membrane-anchored ribosome-binding protein
VSASTTTENDVAALRADIAALQRDVGILIGQLRSGATNGAYHAADQSEESATRSYRDFAAEGVRTVMAVEQQIEDRPLMAVLIAAGVGYIGGRLLSR